jgi:sporulation protein YlmC with PRC-barrel domain
MKRLITLRLAGTAAVLSLGLLSPRLLAANANENLGNPNLTSENAITKVDKASSLIGMDVRNAQNEKLGEIKDLVVDLHSGKIEYAVMGVGGFLGIGDKYVAIPTSAFSLAPGQNELMLNADKAKVQNAPTFAKDNWPDIHSPTWRTDAAYWMNGNAVGNTALGSPAETHTGTASERFGATSSTEHHLATAGADTFRGRITMIDPHNRTMTVQGPAGTREFKVSEQSTITTKDNRNPRLSDLKVGYPVVVGYHENNGTFVANSIMRTDSPDVKE